MVFKVIRVLFRIYWDNLLIIILFSNDIVRKLHMPKQLKRKQLFTYIISPLMVSKKIHENWVSRHDKCIHRNNEYKKE